MYLTKKCVIFYPHIDEYGGIERNIIGLAIEVFRHGYQPLILCYYDHVQMRQFAPELEIIELSDHLSPFRKAQRLRYWLRENQGMITGMPFFFGAKAGFYAYLSGVRPYVLHYTDIPSMTDRSLERSSSIRRWVSDWIISQGVAKAKRLITMTRWNATDLEALYSRSCEVVYQGGAPSNHIVPNIRRMQSDCLRLFSICRVVSSKRLDWILFTGKSLAEDAWFKAHFKRLEIVIAGKGPDEDRLKGISRQLGIEHMVKFPGFISMQELEKEFSSADLFLVPGAQGYGIPVLEALYRRVPVVMNVESNVSEILADNPWVAISEDSMANFFETVLQFVTNLKEQYPLPEVLSELPTESSWAREIGERSLWWTKE